MSTTFFDFVEVRSGCDIVDDDVCSDSHAQRVDNKNDLSRTESADSYVLYVRRCDHCDNIETNFPLFDHLVSTFL